MKYILLALLSLCLHIPAFASPEMKALFTQTFNSHYKAADCFYNVVRLLELAEKNKININNANILYITNEGTSMFGHVKAEHTRGRTGVGDRNWYFHAVLEMDGLVYDYDFGITPRVVSVQEYFTVMFLSEKTSARPDFRYIGPERKKEDYAVKIIDGLTELRSRSTRGAPAGEEVRLGEFLKRF